MTRLLIVTDLPTPYRQPVFAELSSRVELVVAYIHQASDRGWQWWEHLDDHEHRFLSIERPTGARSWFTANRRLAALYDELRPEVVVAGGWNLPTSWYVAARGRRTATCLWIESTRFDGRSTGRARARAKRLLVRSVDGVLVPGSRSRDYALELGARTIVVAPNAVANDRFVAATAGTAPIADGGPRVLFVGRLAEEKGLDVLVDASASLASGATLTFIGDGPLRTHLASRLRELGVDARFEGPVSEQGTIARFLHDSDVLVLPSRSEPWGLVVNEAMAAATPVVVSDVVGCGPDLVLPGITGEVTPMGDSDALADAIDVVWRRGRTAAFAAAAAEVASRHSPTRCADGFVELCDTLLSGRPHR